jgi:LysM repeat protein/regulator of replication initiation timing
VNGFLPPVIFEIQANAAGAIASFKKVNTELSTMEAKALKAGKALTGFQKAAVVGTRALKIMGLAFAAFAAYGIREIVKLEKSYVRLGQAMANAGVATEANLESTSKMLDSYGKLGIGADVAADAFSVLITATQDIDKSNRLLAISADLARQKSIPLADAARTMARATQGSAKAFKELGINIDTTLPKAEGIDKAIDQLAQRVGGQALAYTKTFAGQLAILTENIDALAEQIGMKVLPVLNKFVGGLMKSGEWVKKNQEFVIALGIAITVALIPAVVNLTKKLALLALTILKSPIGRLAAIVFAVAYAFVRAYNSSEDFRKKIASVAKFGMTAVGYLVGVVETLARGLSNAEGAGLKLRKAFQQLKGDDTGAAKTAQQIKDWEAEHKKIGNWTKAIEKAKKKVDDFAKKKISITWDFAIPKIPGFDNGTGGDESDEIKEIADALINARQRAIDFKNAMLDTAKEIHAQWKYLVRRDIKDAIRFGLLDPVDQLVEQVGTLMNAYDKASSKFAGANSTLIASQRAYKEAIKGTDKALIASAESALKRAEESVNTVMGLIGTSLEDLQKLQDDIINTIISLYQKIDELKRERVSVIEEANLQEAKLTKEHLKELAKMQKDHDRQVAQAQSEAVKRAADIVKQSVDQLRGVYRSATQKGIGDIFASLTFEGKYLKGGTVEKLLGALGLQTSKAKVLADDAAKLSGLGFTQTFIEQVIAQGPEVGHELAQTILKSTPESIQQLQSYWSALEQQSQHGVDAIAKQMNSGIVLATEELTAQLAQVGKDLTDTLASLTQDLAESTADAVADYKEALLEIQNATAKTVAAIDADINKYEKQITILEQAAATIATTPPPSTSSIIPFLPKDEMPVETLPFKPDEVTPPTTNLPYVPTPVTPKATTTTSKYVVKPGDTLSAIAKANDISLKKLLADNPKFTEVDKYKGGNMIWAGTTVNIKATTNATSQSIANDVGWAIRTSSDVQYGSSTPSAADVIAARRMRDGYL